MRNATVIVANSFVLKRQHLMIYALSLAVVLVLFPFYSHAQINDCAGAEVVCDSADLAFNPIGPGLNDFADPDNIPGCITSLEQNSAWYYFEIDPLAPSGLILGFTIHPKGGYGEDYDWALYGPDVECGALGAPIRCSSSSAFCDFCPETGMGMGTTDVTEGPGTGDGFVMTLPVEPGQGYYLLIDNWQGTNNGFILTWEETAAEYLNCEAEPPCALSALAGNDISACEDDPAFMIHGSGTGLHGNETYAWSGTNGGTDFLSDPNIANPTVTLPPGFSGSITYTLVVTEGLCFGEDQMVLTVFPLPSISINQAGPFCQNNPAQTLSATPPGGMWGGAATGNSFNPMTAGPGTHNVTYTYTNINNCSATESIDIEVYIIPEVSIDSDPADFCDSEGSILLTATGSGGANGFIYNWDTPSGNAMGDTYNATLSGNHTVSVTDANGCTNTSVTVVTAHPNPEVEIIDPGPVCETLEFMQLNADPPGGTFDGPNFSIDGEFNPNEMGPGTYPITYTYVDAFGCEGSDAQNIIISTVSNATATDNGPLCAGQQILLFGETDGAGSEIIYQWQGPDGYTSNMQNPTDATLGGDYILQVIIDGCPSIPSVTTVVLIDMPEAMATNNGPICNGQSIQLFGSNNTPGSNINYAWSGPNGYTSVEQNPTNASEAGIYSLIITVGTCTSAVTTTEVIFSEAPDAVATNSGPYCAGETIQLFGNTATSGISTTYTWTGPNGYASNDQNPVGTLEGGLYQLTVNVDGCNSPVSQTTVIINPLPQPVITGPNDFCTGFSATLDAGPGYMNYLWNEASQNQMLEVTSSGTYQVTVTDANGCTGTTSISVTETPSLTPFITGSLEFCEGSSTILDAGSGFTNYEWSTGEFGQTIIVTEQGNYGVIVMDADGCSGSANITTTVNSNPDVMIGGSTTFCIGGFTVLDAGPGYSTYSWSNSSADQTISVTLPGMYSVDVVDNNGCMGSSSVLVEESTSLNPVITGSNAFCENGSTILNAGSGFATYEWSDGSTGQFLEVNTTAIYSVSVSDGQGCSGESSVAVMEVLPPSAELEAGAILCNTQAGGSNINLYDLIISGDMNGSWEDADNSGAVGLFNNLNFANIPAGDYHFTYTTNSAIDPCPEATYDIIVTVLDCACPDVMFFNAPPLCNADGVFDLASIENTSEAGTWSIIQTPPGTNPAVLNGSVLDATGSDPGEYSFQFSLQNPPPPGCPLDFQIVLDVDDAPDAGESLPPVSYCSEENQIIILNDLITGEDLNGVWKETSATLSSGTAFDPDNGMFNTENQLAGVYTFEYTLESGGACPDDLSEVSVVINPLPVVSIDDFGVLDCIHTVQSLDAGSSSSGPEYQVGWTGPGILLDGNENTLYPTINKPGVYQLTITNIVTGCKNAASVTVIQNTDAPSGAVINSQNPSCFGDQNGFINIEQVIGGIAPYVFSLNDGLLGNNSLFDQLSEGNYTLALEDATGCKWDTLITLTEPSEIAINVGEDMEIEFGDEAVIQATVNIPPGEIDTIIWTPDNILECFDMTCLEGTAHAFNTVTLSATVYDIYGCEATDELIIKIKKGRRVFIPSVFTPDGDGINDMFYIFGSDRQIVKIKKFLIYNRWGDLLHEATDFLPNDPSKGWGGYFKNQLMNPGVFAYVAEIEFIDGLVVVYNGDVTLLK